jgi:hypothetical protein
MISEGPRERLSPTGAANDSCTSQSQALDDFDLETGEPVFREWPDDACASRSRKARQSVRRSQIRTRPRRSPGPCRSMMAPRPSQDGVSTSEELRSHVRSQREACVKSPPRRQRCFPRLAKINATGYVFTPSSRAPLCECQRYSYAMRLPIGGSSGKFIPASYLPTDGVQRSMGSRHIIIGGICIASTMTSRPSSRDL